MGLLPVAGKALLAGRVYANNARVAVQNRIDVAQYPAKTYWVSSSKVVPPKTGEILGICGFGP
jgi:hypothetical protein